MLAPRPLDLRAPRDINLWRTPLALSLGAIVLFGVTMIPDVLDKYAIIHIPSWLTMGSIDDARAILSATMGAVATVLALIFSVALLVLSMVATLFGPRLLYRFMQDRVTQRTVGLFMGTFIYIGLCFLVTHEDPESRFVPQISLITSWILVIASFASLVYYSHRIATSIQNPDMIARIARDIYPAVVRSHARTSVEGEGALPDDAAVLARAATGAIVACPTSGYLQHFDHAALVAAARDQSAMIVLRFRPGQFVLRGEPLASIVPASAASVLEKQVDRCVAFGDHRTLVQDSEFGIAQIVEIAIRALSPAVNDTFTGVACVDWLADALLALAENPPLEGNWYDASGVLRVWTPAVRLERLVKLAFDQIRQASTTTPAVLIRQLDAIRRLSARMSPAARMALRDQAEAIRECAAAGAVALDRRDLDAAFERARAELDALAAAA
ncbi:MAG TPA: DUF2254 domain-containing protein [Kofleriaceae bacterium]|nr:DUF2254 domain-containing protein [Kofleriaceae bacterium]